MAAPEAGQVTRWWTRLAGRGRWLILAGVAGAWIGGSAGWWGWGQVTYRAQGVVQLGVAHDTLDRDETAFDLRMDEVVERELAQLRRTAGNFSHAIQEAATSNPRQPDADGLVVQARRAADAATRLDLIATAHSPQTVTDAVKSILADYQDQTKLSEDAAAADAWNDAQARLRGLRAEAAAGQARQAQTRAAMSENNRENPQAYAGPITESDPAWSAAIWTQNEARRASAVVRDRLSVLESLPVPEAEQVAALDPEAAAWSGRMRALNAQLADAVWPPNPGMAERLRERVALEAQLQTRMQDTRIAPLGDAGLAFRAVRLSETQSQLTQLAEAQEFAEQRVAELEPRLAAWRELNAQVQAAEASVAMQEAAAAQLAPGSGVRLAEAAMVTPDAVVWHDGRPARAVLGAGLGWLAGVLICGGVFILDKRVRRSRDGGLVGSAVPVLGAVPTAVEALDKTAAAGGEQPTEVASIQAVRAVLESKMRPARDSSNPESQTPYPGGAFAVTGIAAGSGATSVAVGLAASMALSGSRVLLVDLAWLQKPAGTGTDDDAARAGLGIDGVIEELGYLDDEDRETIALGDESDVGFGAILRGVSLRRSVVQTRVAGLSVLSAMGRAEALRAEWAGRVSSRWLSKLMEVARRGGYTATILDAGSATGSVEGMIGCAAADGTVLVVSGGQTQAHYDKAVNRLRLVGADILGTVLNRSDAKRLGGKQASRAAARLASVGGTTGSGIFAAAIEAQSGSGLLQSGSGLVTAPLPRVEDDTTLESYSAADIQPAGLPSAFTPEGVSPPEPSIPIGVDPFSEPPADVQPTPPRQPPSRAADDDTFDITAAPPIAGAAPLDASSDTEADTPPPNPEPEIHVADDVMDQLVDHAIRAAQRPRQPNPPADSAP